MIGQITLFKSRKFLLPLFNSIKPILNTKPEDLANGVLLNHPKGKIELNNICVRYENPNKYNFIDTSILNTYDSEQYISPWILQDINLSINENDNDIRFTHPS